MFNIFRKNYEMTATLNEATWMDLSWLLECMDYHGIEHDFYVEPVSFHEFLNEIGKYRIIMRASKKQIEKFEYVLNSKNVEFEIKAA